MPNAANANADWPRFQLIQYCAPTGIPNGWDAELLKKGAPDGLVCTASRELTLLEDPGSGPLVCFGISGPYGRICLDPHTMLVVHVEYGAFQTGYSAAEIAAPPDLVGSSLDQFIAMVRAATDRFPFDSDLTVRPHGVEASEDEETREERCSNEWAQAVLDLEKTLQGIDQAAVAATGGFWLTFLADVGMGIYSTENLLNPPEC